MLGAVRSFFAKRDVLEVDCPAIVNYAPFDHTFIALMHVESMEERKFLHSSPEYGMKRLLSEGLGDIYQMSHVFRAGEWGKKHNPEFTMIEWYRVGKSFEFLIDETISLLSLFIGSLPVEKYTYREAVRRFAGIDYPTATKEELISSLEGISLPDDYKTWGECDLLQAVMAFIVEPHLGNEKFSVIHDYPPDQASLSRIDNSGPVPVAKRFEIYYHSHELANGYLELLDAKEQESRFVHTNELRKAKGLPEYAPDVFLLEALSLGLPDCVGVAVGFDRLLMIKEKVDSIAEILPFDWPHA